MSQFGQQVMDTQQVLGLTESDVMVMTSELVVASGRRKHLRGYLKRLEAYGTLHAVNWSERKSFRQSTFTISLEGVVKNLDIVIRTLQWYQK